MTDPTENNEFCSPSTLNVPFGIASGNIECLRETKLSVSLGASQRLIVRKLTLDRAVQVRALAGVNVLCSWVRNLTLKVSLSIHTEV